jgi:hypothetical protein
MLKAFIFKESPAMVKQRDPFFVQRFYDPATNSFVSHQGFASVDLPSRGAIAHWDGYTAKYIGW